MFGWVLHVDESDGDPFPSLMMAVVHRSEVLLTLSGTLDGSAVAALEPLQEWLCSQAGPEITVDAGDLVFIDLVFLRALIELARLVRSSGGFLVVGAWSEPLAQLCAASGLNANLELTGSA
jgi:anti-anti-sigma factor